MTLLPESQSNRPVRRRGALAVVAAALSLVVLVACGSDTSDVPEDRQFANEPVATRAATDEPAAEPTVDAASAGQQAPRHATPETLLRTRGAPSTLYTVSGDRIVALTVAGESPSETTLSLPEGVDILGFDASAPGDRVGVLMRGQDGTPVVQFFDRNGEPISQAWSLAPAATPQASPAASPVATAEAEGGGAVSVSWIPQGDGVLVVTGSTVTAVSIGDGPRAVDTSAVGGEILHASVSPKGDQVLLHVGKEDGTEGAFLLDRASGSVHEVRALRTGPGAGISYLTWLPGGNGVLFVEGELTGDVVVRGQLYRYLFRNEVPQLIATSGQGGPLATITNVAISPDGHSVAYDVSVWDAGEWSAHSMWVRSLREDVPGIQVPVVVGEPVLQIAWSEAGLFWAQEQGGAGDSLSLNLVTPGGQVEAIQPGASPAASPVASPVTSVPPLATPDASPGATPVNEPVPVTS